MLLSPLWGLDVGADLPHDPSTARSCLLPDYTSQDSSAEYDSAQPSVFLLGNARQGWQPSLPLVTFDSRNDSGRIGRHGEMTTGGNRPDLARKRE